MKIRACIHNYIHVNNGYVNTYACWYFNGDLAKLQMAWMSDNTTHKTMGVITYPYSNMHALEGPVGWPGPSHLACVYNKQ